MSFKYPDFKFIKKYYDLNCYTKEDVKDYTDGGAITKEQFEEITGKKYPEDTQA